MLWLDLLICLILRDLFGSADEDMHNTEPGFVETGGRDVPSSPNCMPSRDEGAEEGPHTHDAVLDTVEDPASEDD